jgi:hypothetical protein
MLAFRSLRGGVMLEEFRARRAAGAYESKMRRWEERRRARQDQLGLALNYRGSASADILLTQGEALFYTLTGAGLVENRRKPGHYRGGSSGVSVGFGPVRTRVGSTRGRYTQGPVVPTVIDAGTAYVTNKRVVFRGGKQTRECRFQRLIGVSYEARSVTLSLTNRQHPVELRTGNVAADFAFYLQLALAHYRGTVPELVSRCRAELAQIDATRPVAMSASSAAARHKRDTSPLERPRPQVIGQIEGADAPAGGLTPERKRAMYAYEEYCLAQVAWADADPAVRGPEPQWADYQPRPHNAQ